MGWLLIFKNFYKKLSGNAEGSKVSFFNPLHEIILLLIFIINVLRKGIAYTLSPFLSSGS